MEVDLCPTAYRSSSLTEARSLDEPCVKPKTSMSPVESSDSPVESSFVLKVTDSPVESSIVLNVADSPVESSFVNIAVIVQFIVKSSGIHVDYVGDGKVLVMPMSHSHPNRSGHEALHRGLYSPPGILPRIQLESWNSARLITEFDIPAESAWNIMGIVFLFLCLVIPYRVQPDSMKKK